jgi:predicted alpha/beta-hydrolase family hydrolase
MHHHTMAAIADALASHGVATFRYQFPYAEQGRRAPNRRPQLLESVRAAVEEARGHARGLPLLAGGKSMGGRMTSLAQAEKVLPGVCGLVFFGFPLHAAGSPSQERGMHLYDVALPMLFLQGTRDRLASLELLRPLCRKLGRRASLYVVEDADHSFHVLKRTARSDGEVLDELAREVARFAGRAGKSGCG